MRHAIQICTKVVVNCWCFIWSCYENDFRHLFHNERRKKNRFQGESEKTQSRIYFTFNPSTITETQQLSLTSKFKRFVNKHMIKILPYDSYIDIAFSGRRKCAVLVNKDYKHESTWGCWRRFAQRALILFMFIAAKSMFYTSSMKSEIYLWPVLVRCCFYGRYYVTRLLIASRKHRSLHQPIRRLRSGKSNFWARCLNYLSRAGMFCIKLALLLNILFDAITCYVTCKILSLNIT